jgi:UDP-3-O-[3-hydroxymyristoyl] N-acetylglucosamine deacetylase
MAGGWTPGRQSTLRKSATVSGIGVHSGRPASLTIHPASAGSGICFQRGSLEDGHMPVRAHYSNVSAMDFCTAVGVNGSSVATIEHLMATLSALAIDNATIEIDGPEVPVMDGSAGAFIEALDEAGIAALDAPRRYIKVLRPVSVEHGAARAEFLPHDAMRVEIEIDFANPLVGRQCFAADIDGELFRRELARARTFGFLADVEGLWARGLALGASLENAVVVGDDRVLNPEGLRFADEFVRHKALDAIGDLALAGAPILGLYRSWRGGHRLNVMALEALMADRSAWTVVQGAVPVPERTEVLHLGGALAGAVAYAPDAS